MNSSVLICDDIRLEASGKLILVGVYTGNILIPQNDVQVQQLFCLFSADWPIDAIPRKVGFEITLPGGSPQQSFLDVPVPETPDSQYRFWQLRHVITVPEPILREGKIVAKLISDGSENPVSAPWIQVGPLQQISPSIDRSPPTI